MRGGLHNDMRLDSLLGGYIERREEIYCIRLH